MNADLVNSSQRGRSIGRRALLIGVLVLLLVGWAVSRFEAGEPLLVGGIQVNEADHDVWVRTLDDQGLDTVSVTVYAHQGDWDSWNLWWDEEAPWVVHEMRAAKKQGLRVVLILRVALDHAFERNRFYWHGMIMPRSEEDLAEWFRRYNSFVERWARVAAEEGVDVLAIASELNALTNTARIDELPVLEEYWTNAEKVEDEQGRVLEYADVIESRHLQMPFSEGYDDLDSYFDDEAAAQAFWARQTAFLESEKPLERINERRTSLEKYWQEVIARVREVYDGRLTYAANFDQYEFVTFWDRLDLMGINAYFPLREQVLEDFSSPQMLSTLEGGWRSVLGSIDRFRIEQGIPDHKVLFTELGYVRRENCTIQPWAASGFKVLGEGDEAELLVWEDQAENLEERALALQALYRVNLDLEMLAGILYWKLSTEPAHIKEEPFVLILGEKADPDPLLDALRGFGKPLRRQLWRRQAAEGLQAFWEDLTS